MASDRLAALTHAMWAEHIGSTFALRHGDGLSENLQLTDVNKLGGGRPLKVGDREPYALVFRAASRQFFLPQRIYPLNHPALGEIEIFLVPLGPDEHGMRFEAIFS